MKSKYIECGKIINTHGVRGLLKVEPWCDSPGVFASLRRVFLRGAEGGFEERRIRSASVSKNTVITELDGVTGYEDAVSLKNRTVWCLREDSPVPDGAVLICDLIGLPVIDADSGRVYGTLEEIVPSPASDLYVIVTGGGKKVLFPAVSKFVEERDPERGIFIRPIPGFFDDEI